MTSVERVAWLLERRKGVGASDAAAIAGVSEWATALEVYLKKTELGPPAEEPVEMQFKRGHFFEPVCAKLYANATGEQLEKPPAIIWHEHLSWMFASLDYRRTRDKRPVECKTTRSMNDWGEPGTDQIPGAYTIQAQHQMEVTDEPYVDFSVMCGFDHYIYTVKRDYEIGAMLIDLESEFWERVVNRDPPDPDFAHTTTPEVVKKLFTKVEPRTVQLSLAAVKLQEEYEQHKDAESAAKKAKELVFARMKVMCGDAEIAELPNGNKWYRKEVNRAGYTVDPTSYISLIARNATKSPSNKRGK